MQQFLAVFVAKTATPGGLLACWGLVGESVVLRMAKDYQGRQQSLQKSHKSEPLGA